MTLVEAWLPVVGFDGYEVSNLAKVRSWRTRGGTRPSEPRILKPVVTSEGYLQHGLRRDGQTHIRLLHRLVLEAFRGPCPEGQEGRHVRDNNPKVCALDNLEWGTRQENADDRERHGTVSRGQLHGELTNARTPRGVRHHQAKLCDGDVRVVEMLSHEPGIDQSEIGDAFGIHQSTVSKIRLHKIWRHVA